MEGKALTYLRSKELNVHDLPRPPFRSSRYACPVCMCSLHEPTCIPKERGLSTTLLPGLRFSFSRLGFIVAQRIFPFASVSP
jgi:hypothetical protein